MDLQEKVLTLGKRMYQENVSLREEVLEQSAIRFKDDLMENGVTRLIHNHAVNKTTLGVEILGLSKNTYNKRIAQFIEDGIIDAPYYYNRAYMFTLSQVHAIMDYLGFEKYADHYDSVVVNNGNYKGGTGKTTTTTTLAVKAALDLELNARILIIDQDPQGGGRGIISIEDEAHEIFITASDLVRSQFEEDSNSEFMNEATELLKAGHSFEDIVLAAPFSTHLPNLDVLTAFPTDEQFTKLYWTLSEEKRVEMLTTFANKIMPILKTRYDIIFLDLPPQNSPITWSAIEATDMLLMPITPRSYDYASTMSGLLTMSEQLSNVPSQGKNVRWFKILPVNYNESNKQERRTYDRLLRALGTDMITKTIKHSPFFHEAAEKSRTIYDIIKTESDCTDIQYNDAISSTDDVYKTFIAELKVVATKSK